MADKRISQLNALTSPTGSDLLVIVNNNETKKITYADLVVSLTGSETDLSSLNAFTASYFTSSASFDSRVDILENWSSSLTNTFATDLEVQIVSSSVAATIGIISQNTGLVSTSSFNTFTSSQQVLNNRFATTGSNSFSGSQLISGSLIPAVGVGTFTSSFSLGSPTNAWKDIYVSHGSIIFVDAETQATASFKIVANQEIQYTNGITASYFDGDGSRLKNLPAITNWNKGKEYILRETEQLTFSGDYILEDSYLLIEGGVTASIGEWGYDIFTNGPTGSITRNSNNQYTIIGPSGDTNGGNGLHVKRLFDTETTMSVYYTWSGDGTGNDRPYYDVSTYEPLEPTTTSRLQDTNAVSESGTWTINVPSGSWVAIGVWTDFIDATSGSLQITLPYIQNEDISQYSPNKYFKKEGTIFIGGNLLVKDSTIVNNGKISVGGEVILIGNSEITGTGTII